MNSETLVYQCGWVGCDAYIMTDLFAIRYRNETCPRPADAKPSCGCDLVDNARFVGVREEVG